MYEMEKKIMITCNFEYSYVMGELHHYKKVVTHYLVNFIVIVSAAILRASVTLSTVHTALQS